MIRAFERCTAQLNVYCIPHYDRCFDQYFQLKKAGCKDEQRILQAKNDGLTEFRSKVDHVAIAIKADNEFVKMVKDSTKLKAKNQSYTVIGIFENVIDLNASELKKNPDEGFSWWPTKTQMVILIALPVAVGAFTYFCCAVCGTGCGTAVVAGAGIAVVAGAVIAVGAAIILGLGYVVYKYREKNKQIEKIGDKLRQPNQKHLYNANINGRLSFELNKSTDSSETPYSI